MTISEAMNVWPAALAELVERGYVLHIEFDDDDQCQLWWATRGDTRLGASNPVALLGLAALAEARPDSWASAPEGQKIYTRLLGGESVEPGGDDLDRQ